MSRCLLLTAVAIAASLASFAQTDRGTITGTVSDPAGAVIAGAMIEAKNQATGAVYQAATSSTGNYTVAQLPAGSYDLTVTAMGFKQFIRQGLVVEVAGILRVDAAMQVGAATESVTVTEAAPLLKTESAEVSYNVATETLNNLPLLVLAGGASNYFQSSGGLGNIRNPLSSRLNSGLSPNLRASPHSPTPTRRGNLHSDKLKLPIPGSSANRGPMFSAAVFRTRASCWARPAGYWFPRQAICGWAIIPMGYMFRTLGKSRAG
jgi:hypothetical protein